MLKKSCMCNVSIAKSLNKYSVNKMKIDIIINGFILAFINKKLKTQKF